MLNFIKRLILGKRKFPAFFRIDNNRAHLPICIPETCMVFSKEDLESLTMRMQEAFRTLCDDVTVTASGYTITIS